MVRFHVGVPISNEENIMYKIVKTKEEALALCEDGHKVGIGYLNSHIVYRVNVNREVKSLSYQYTIC